MSMVQTQIKWVLHEASTTLCPAACVDPYIKKHIWANKKYVGADDVRTASWRGWSINLKKITPDYHTLYIDEVPNILDSTQQELLFGEDFVRATQGMSNYVVMHVGKFSSHHREAILRAGFTPKTTGNKLHATFVVDTKLFLDGSIDHWALLSVKLAQFQRNTLNSSLPAQPINGSVDSDADYLDDILLLDFE